LEEDLADDLKWSMRVNQVLFSGKSQYQEVDLIDVGPFGKVRCQAAPQHAASPPAALHPQVAVHRWVRRGVACACV
jgi:thermospermine synthase